MVGIFQDIESYGHEQINFFQIKNWIESDHRHSQHRAWTCARWLSHVEL